MAPDVRVKCCGLRRAAEIEAAAAAGAAYVGFVFFPKSPRSVTPTEANALATAVPPGICKVALVVDRDDAALEDILNQTPIDMLQLHGSETPDRVAEVKARFGLPVMKAIGVAGPDDLVRINAYADVADQLLIDAKAPKTADLPGGNGLAFDWRLIADVDWPLPWMLAGGLTPDNVVEAIRLTGARQVDVSSGIESQPGEKSIPRIQAFLRAAHSRTAPAA